VPVMQGAANSSPFLVFFETARDRNEKVIKLKIFKIRFIFNSRLLEIRSSFSHLSIHLTLHNIIIST